MASAGGRGAARSVAIGAVGGLLLGGLARAWMRWIATDPEFSWGGTLAIVVSFVLFGAGQAAAGHARRAGHAPRRVAVSRGVAGVLTLGLFGGAGALMAPTIVFGSIALWRSDRSRVLRAVAGLVALVPVGFVTSGIVQDFGVGIATAGRVLTLAAIYGAIVTATRPAVAPVEDGWRPSGRTRVAVVVLVATPILAALAIGGVR